MADKAKQDIEPSWTGQLDLTVFIMASVRLHAISSLKRH